MRIRLSQLRQIIREELRIHKLNQSLNEAGYEEGFPVVEAEADVPTPEDVTDVYSATASLEKFGGKLVDTQELGYEGAPGKWNALVYFDRGQGELDYNGYGNTEENAIIDAIAKAFGFGNM